MPAERLTHRPLIRDHLAIVGQAPRLDDFDFAFELRQRLQRHWHLRVQAHLPGLLCMTLRQAKRRQWQHILPAAHLSKV